MINNQRSMFNEQPYCTTLMTDRKYDLEERLVDYTCRMIDVVEALPSTRAGN